MKIKELEIQLYGRVQGVGFRWMTKNEAEKLGLKGIVLNKDDGSVSIICQGNEEKLKRFILWIQTNPGFSNISGISYFWRDMIHDYPDFQVVREGNLILDKTKSLVNLGKYLFRRKTENVPIHVAVIPDGNRRWAKEKGMASHLGHYSATSFDHMNELFSEARNYGVKYLTFWGFSTENWKRSKQEIKAIFDIILSKIEEFRADSEKYKIRFRHVGRKDRLPRKIVFALEMLEKETVNYADFNVQLCLDYGGRDEILTAVNKLIKEGKEKIKEKDFSLSLFSKDLPDPDLIIRTSGEYRTSGFMPFQAVYAELYFCDKHFPDFTASDLREAIEEYGRRQRRFGGK